MFVPNSASQKALVSVYGDFAVDVRQWRASIDKRKTAVTPKATKLFMSRPLHDKTLESLDDEAGTLMKALASARYLHVLIQAVVFPSGRSNGPGTCSMGRDWGIPVLRHLPPLLHILVDRHLLINYFLPYSTAAMVFPEAVSAHASWRVSSGRCRATWMETASSAESSSFLDQRGY